VAGIDPEEAFVASIASCHMLTYIYVASKQGFQIDGYHDDAVGLLSKNDLGALWISAVTLHQSPAYGELENDCLGTLRITGLSRTFRVPSPGPDPHRCPWERFAPRQSLTRVSKTVSVLLASIGHPNRRR